MTKDSLSEVAGLRAFLSETSDSNLLAEMPGFVADRFMALDVDRLCGAEAHERSDDRLIRPTPIPKVRRAAGQCRG
ncbi:hypothetical protein Q4577_22560 [Marinovum sp. 2_MG-2023]|uniref:hypothetical protein n=1 Tax=Marinovum sp. 2_MG-2023 TaxID=3062637 RepID=UPI0026E3E56C|nr:MULTISPECIES: hypothetical protein [unclassified Marinovum]MDO6732810.1 hypothetical protein [Marinovum sp. 2_MG-2023]MDO6782079.1 hypothetical protein [Marinovum sp. 1_MG-2023]